MSVGGIGVFVVWSLFGGDGHCDSDPFEGGCDDADQAANSLTTETASDRIDSNCNRDGFVATRG